MIFVAFSFGMYVRLADAGFCECLCDFVGLGCGYLGFWFTDLL